MRTRLIGFFLGVVLAAVPVSSALADTTADGGADLGLDAITITSGSVNGGKGVVTLHGTIGCSKDVTVWVTGNVAQVVGRFHTIVGNGGAMISCLAAKGTAAFALTVRAEQGKFAPGRARIDAFADTSVCDEFDCLDDSVSFGPVAMRLTRR